MIMLNERENMEKDRVPESIAHYEENVKLKAQIEELEEQKKVLIKRWEDMKAQLVEAQKPHRELHVENAELKKRIGELEQELKDLYDNAADDNTLLEYKVNILLEHFEEQNKTLLGLLCKGE